MATLSNFASAFLSCFLFLCGEVNAETRTGGHGVVTFCYVPFDVATSAPMTISNFSRSCTDIGVIDATDRRYLELVTLFMKARRGPFLSEGMRVRMTFPDAMSIYIDDAGGVLIGASRVKLDRAGFLRVKTIINDLAEKRGIHLME